MTSARLFAWLMHFVCLLAALVLWPVALLGLFLAGERRNRRLIGKEVVCG